MCEEKETRSRSAPVLPPSELFEARPCLAGYGVFALQDIPSGTVVQVAPAPEVNVIGEGLKQKTCAWCFEYNEDGEWSISFKNCPGVVFCCEDCKVAWRGKYGEEGLEAFAAANRLLQSYQRSARQCDDSQWPEEEPIEVMFNEAWSKAEAQASLIYAYRCAPTNGKARTNITAIAAQKEAMDNAMALPVYDASTMLSILDGILAPPEAWAKVDSLKVEPMWRNSINLKRAISAFLHLHCVLPVNLLKKGVLARERVEHTIGADHTNSFGIRDERGQDLEAGVPPGIMLGYGIWVEASFFNHACGYNIHRTRIGRKWIFKTNRDVCKGEELCITYCRDFETDRSTVQERRNMLQLYWGFECQCQSCMDGVEVTVNRTS